MTKKILSALTIIFFSFSTYAVEVDANHIAKSKNGMVVTNGDHATAIGVEILKKGGNAVDAAIAVSFALSVELQDAMGLGGGGFTLISMDGKKYFYDYREQAPEKASMNMYKDAVEDNNSANGSLSVAVPSTTIGLEVLHQKHGSLPWKDLVQPAIDLAMQGLVMDQRLTISANFKKKFMVNDLELKKRFLDYKGEPLPIGTKIPLPELTRTLTRIRDQGAKYMMEGEFADDVIKRLGKKGVLQKSDFLKYEVKAREPYVAKYKDYTFYLAPSPSSGGVVLAELFNMLNYVKFKKRQPLENQRKIIEMYKVGFFDRAKYMGDSDFVKIPTEIFTKEYAKTKAAAINKGENITYDPKTVTGEDDIHTAHFNIVDSKGNVVSSTLTHNYYFGSGISVNGVVLNDEMDDFSIAPGVANAWGLIGSFKNSVAPFKRPLSSMSPSIAEKNGKFVMSFGGRGGAAIITLSFLVANRILNEGMTPKEAFEKYYFHHQTFPNKVILEKSDDSAKFSEYLKSKGYEVDEREIPKWSGKVNVIYKAGDEFTAVTDPREPGKALGY
jgi:gamma-glutamyltranspeptidase/glutathione hydrolase